MYVELGMERIRVASGVGMACVPVDVVIDRYRGDGSEHLRRVSRERLKIVYEESKGRSGQNCEE